jgi:hypothetical protein
MDVHGEISATEAVLRHVHVSGVLTNNEGEVVKLGGPSWQIISQSELDGESLPMPVQQGQSVRLVSGTLHLTTRDAKSPSELSELQIEASNLAGFGPPLITDTGLEDTYLNLTTGDTYKYTNPTTTAPNSWIHQGNIADNRSFSTYARVDVENQAVILDRAGLQVILRYIPDSPIPNIIGWFVMNNTETTYAVNVDQGNHIVRYTSRVTAEHQTLFHLGLLGAVINVVVEEASPGSADERVIHRVIAPPRIITNTIITTSNNWVQISNGSADVLNAQLPTDLSLIMKIKMFPIQGQLLAYAFDIRCIRRWDDLTNFQVVDVYTKATR